MARTDLVSRRKGHKKSDGSPVRQTCIKYFFEIFLTKIKNISRFIYSQTISLIFKNRISQRSKCMLECLLLATQTGFRQHIKPQTTNVSASPSAFLSVASKRVILARPLPSGSHQNSHRDLELASRSLLAACRAAFRPSQATWCSPPAQTARRTLPATLCGCHTACRPQPITGCPAVRFPAPHCPGQSRSLPPTARLRLQSRPLPAAQLLIACCSAPAAPLRSFRKLFPI